LMMFHFYLCCPSPSLEHLPGEGRGSAAQVYLSFYTQKKEIAPKTSNPLLSSSFFPPQRGRSYIIPLDNRNSYRQHGATYDTTTTTTQLTHALHHNGFPTLRPNLRLDGPLQCDRHNFISFTAP
jgi:hypothetical protein